MASLGMLAPEMTSADFAAIRQLHAKYCHTIDFGDFDGIAACFAPDGRFEMGSQPGHPANRRGTEGLRRSPTAKAAKGHGRHTTISSMISGDGNTARSLSHLLFSRDYGPALGKGRPPFASIGGTGIYVDDLIKIEGEWVYAHRRYLGDATPDVTALLGKSLEIAHVDAGNTGVELSALDREAIRQLVTRCCHTLDFKDYDGFANCFTADGFFQEGSARDETSGIGRSTSGHDDLREYAADIGAFGFDGFVRHHAVSTLVEGDGEAARASSYGLITVGWKRSQERFFESASIMQTGMYWDDVVKVNGRWLLRGRTFSKDTTKDVRTQAGRPIDLQGQPRASPLATPQ